MRNQISLICRMNNSFNLMGKTKREENNASNANAHKIIQLQNIKTKLWLIIFDAYKAKTKRSFICVLYAKYKQRPKTKVTK